MPVLAVSASASEYTSQEALAAGCTGFLPKPLRLTTLLARIGELLNIHWQYSTSGASTQPATGIAAEFSLDRKLPDLDAYLPAASKPCEVRLLMIEQGHRRGRIFAELLVRAARWGREQGYDLALISATVRQMRLYQHLGFIPFGPPIGTVQAPFCAMYVTWDRVPESVRQLIERE